MIVDNIEELIAKFHSGKCSEKERNILLSYFNAQLDKGEIGLSVEQVDQLKENTWKGIYEQIKEDNRKTISVVHWKKPFTSIAVAVAVALLVIGGVIFKKPLFNQLETRSQVENDIVPLYNGAHLTLEDGSIIDLGIYQTGIEFSDNEIIYTDGTSLSGSKNIGSEKYLLSTPKGSMYQVILSDGTRIILNGGSQIIYPGKFNKGERVVELQGEAYFEVKKSFGDPFIVKTVGQEVKVLGTEFNIATYDLNSIKTTLVEGSVEISMVKGNKSPFLLKPGEQSTVSQDGFYSKKEVNLKKELSWKSGVFYFENTPFSEVLNQVSQWYDVDVIYTSDIPKGTFSGIIDRKVSLKTLLEYFEESLKHQFKLEDKRLKVKIQK